MVRIMPGGLIRLLFVSLQLAKGACELLCPALTELNTTTELTCFTQSNVLPAHSYSQSSYGTVATCSALGSPCIIIQDNYDATFVNSTHSVLTIFSVKQADAGSWSCNIRSLPQDICNMEVMKTPTCSTTSKEGTDVLAQDQELTLTVDIQDYYCSTALTFSLQTGNVTTLLMEADSVANVTHNTSSVTLNVTDSHLGVVGLVFSCHNSQWNLTCDGVTELKTPTCNITSGKDTDRLALNEKLTLSVDIIGFNCSVASNFTLQTGNVQQLLDDSDAEAGIDHATQTFHVTETHLGGVRLTFNCQHRHWNMTCDDITKLENKAAAVPENDGLATASTPIIVVCVVGAIVFLSIAVIIIVFLVKRKQVTRIKPQASLKSSSPPYITVGSPGSSAPNAPNGSKNINVTDAGGYACPCDVVNNAEKRSSSRTEDESHDLSLAATSTDNPKKDLGVVVQHIIPEDNASHVNELYASINKTKDMTMHNDDTAI